MVARGSVWKQCSEHGKTGRGGTPACRKKHGSWFFSIDNPDENGTRRTITQGGHDTKDDAEDALDEIRQEIRERLRPTGKGWTVERWFRKWLEELKDEVAAGNFGEGTWRDYRYIVEQVIIPAVGHHELADLRRSHVAKMLKDARTPDTSAIPDPKAPRPQCASARRDGKPCTNRAVTGWDICRRHGAGKPRLEEKRTNIGRVVKSRSPRRLEIFQSVTRSGLQAAIYAEKLAKNVASGEFKEIPSRSEREPIAYWEPDQTSTFLLDLEHRLALATPTGITLDDQGVPAEPAHLTWAYVDAVQEDALFETTAFCGLRRGEIAGLPTARLELDQLVPGMWVWAAATGISGTHPCYVCGGKHTGVQLKKTPKTDNSYRWLPVPEVAVRKLQTHLAVQAAWKAKLGSAYTDHGLTFAGPTGEPLRPEAIKYRHEQIVTSLGLPDIHLHAMRHGAASLLLAAGVPEETVAQILGHSVAVLRSTYAHILQRPASKGMADAVALVRGPSSGPGRGLSVDVRGQNDERAARGNPEPPSSTA